MQLGHVYTFTRHLSACNSHYARPLPVKVQCADQLRQLCNTNIGLIAWQRVLRLLHAAVLV